LQLVTTAEGTGSDHIHPIVQTAPATPWEVTCEISAMQWPNANFFLVGLCIRQSSDGKLTIFGPGYIAGVNFFVYDSPGTTGAIISRNTLNATAFPKNYLRIADNGTNQIFSWSGDGILFYEQYSRSRTTYMATPDQVGLFVYNANATYGTRVCFDWFRRTV
jgi:hypothetical protein